MQLHLLGCIALPSKSLQTMVTQEEPDLMNSSLLLFTLTALCQTVLELLLPFITLKSLCSFRLQDRLHKDENHNPTPSFIQPSLKSDGVSQLPD